MDKLIHEVDFLVVGSGGGGMVAALQAHEAGLDALLLEKTAHYGGSTARSGGGIWVPNNSLMAEAGVPDSPEEARTYMQATVGDRTPQARQEAYIRNARRMIGWLRRTTQTEFIYMQDYADYYPERPGGKPQGRSLEAKLLNGRRLGAELNNLRPPFVEAPLGLAFTAREYQRLGMVISTWEGKRTAMRVGLRMIWSRLSGKKMLMMGQALIGWLRLALLERNIPIWLNTEFTDLLTEEGRVVGIKAQRESKTVDIKARHGVLLAAGGFPHNLEMRLEHHPHPITTEWSVASEGNTGDAIRAGIAAGAATDLMEDAWWGPSSKPPGEPAFFHVGERGYPGLIMVNQRGRRFVNESASYVDVVHAMYAKHQEDDAHIPSYFLFDGRYRRRYLFGAYFPMQPFPSEYLRNGYIKRAKTLKELASQLDVDPATLTETVERFNAFARRGVDEDFGRGESAYDNYYGDPNVRPNPNLAPLERPPFYAVEAIPGDLGTKGGLLTDEYARVLSENGDVIPGLYCVGNNAASVMGNSYPGAGSTIGPAMTFAWIAARHAAGLKD